MASTDKHLAKLDAIQLALADLRFEFRRGNIDFEGADYRAFLDAVYELTEIDAVYEAAHEIFVAEPEHSGDPRNPYNLTAEERGLVL